MLYYYAEKSRLCLVRHSTIIFYNLLFVKHQLKYLAILPRFASRSAAFLYILIPAHLFSGCRTEISGRKSAAPHSYLLTVFQIRPRSGHRIFSLLTPISSLFQIRPRSGHRIFSLLSPISSLYFKSVRGADTASSHSSLLSPHCISNLSAERTPHLLTPHSYLLTIFQICPRSGHCNF